MLSLVKWKPLAILLEHMLFLFTFDNLHLKKKITTKHFQKTTLWIHRNSQVWSLYSLFNPSCAGWSEKKIYVAFYVYMASKQCVLFNTFGLGQNVCHFVDNVFKFIFLHENCCVFTEISQVSEAIMVYFTGTCVHHAASMSWIHPHRGQQNDIYTCLVSYPSFIMIKVELMLPAAPTFDKKFHVQNIFKSWFRKGQYNTISMECKCPHFDEIFIITCSGVVRMTTPVQVVMNISSKWQPFDFNLAAYSTATNKSDIEFTT